MSGFVSMREAAPPPWSATESRDAATPHPTYSGTGAAGLQYAASRPHPLEPVHVAPCPHID
jgi:hypothetical protein